MGLYHYRWLIIVLLVQIRFYSSNSLHLTCHPRDLEALRDFINELEPKPYGWDFNSSAYCCEWVGITCESSSSLRLNHPNNSARVTKLELVNRKLSGTLSESVRLLDQIRVLNLSKNFIFGSIPPSVFNFLYLETLDLSSNGLIGHIPQSFNLPSLTSMDLSSNKLNGSLPTHVCYNSTNLRLIRLESNIFSGKFLSGFEKCALLEHLLLGWNNLTGYIPDDLFQLQRLNLLDIQENNLSGSLSPSLGNLSRLAHLDVSFNRFSGEIPDVFNKLLELKYLIAQSNRFTGGIPKSLAISQTLILLNLSNNSLSGPLRLNCAVMNNLTSLDLGSNSFNGSLLENLPACRNLRNVDLARNPLGQVPESFKDFHSLSYLSLSNCSIANISSTLHILQKCRNLKTLVLTLNFHGEMLPYDPSLHFDKLVVLVVANCRLTGQMPSWLSKSTSLKMLDLSWNHLTGAIPNWFGGFRDLFYLDLSRNSFTGKISKSLTTLQSLRSGDVSLDELSQDLPFFLERTGNTRSLQYKNIYGFPPTLELSQNNLSGPIWKEFGNLKKLHVFNLNANRLSGSIPSSLSEMTSLESLDLSNNRIYGSIPDSLENLTFMSKFNVANNRLSGRIPSGGQFMSFPNSSFEGNHLCGDYFLQCMRDTLGENQSKTSDSSNYNDIALDFSYGVLLGFGLSLVLVALHTITYHNV